MPQYNSTNKRTQTIGIAGYTENDTVLTTIGNSTFQGNINLGDTDILNFGVGNDLQIFHDGINSIIRDVGEGNLNIRGANTINLQNNTAAKTYAIFNNNSSVDLYFDNVLKFSTTLTGSDVTGTLRASTSLVTTTDGTGITITSNTISGPSTITIDPSAVGDNTGTVVIAGDLQIDGTTTTINSTTITVDDKNIELGSVATPSDTTADSGGITLKGTTDKTFNWISSTGSWTSSENINIATDKTYKINATDVLSADTLGGGVVNSSLTSVGTIGTGTWQGTAINDDYIGTIDNADKVALSSLNIDGGTAATTLTADDLFIIDDGANGTNRSITAANAKTYFASDVSSINLADETTDEETFLTFSPGATGEQALKTNANLTFNSSNGTLSVSSVDVSTSVLLRDDVELNFGTNNDAWFNYNGTGNYLELQLEVDATDFRITDNGIERFRFNKSGEIGLSGANYGTSGQVLTSQGTGTAPIWNDVIPNIIAADESTDTTCFPLFATIDTGTISVKTDASGLRYNSSSETLDINNIRVVNTATIKGTTGSPAAIRVESTASTERFEITYNETTDSLDFSYFAP